MFHTWPVSRCLTGRRVIHLLSALVLLLAGVNCRPRPATPAATITSLQANGGYAESARALAVEFERQTGIRVRVVEAALASLREKTISDVTTRAGLYDVMQVAYQWDGEILPHLQPLEESAGAPLVDHRDFIPTVWTNCGQWGGRVYGLPMACDVVTLLYRTDVFAARSAEFERQTGRPLRPPQTWAEYVEIARFLDSESLYGNIIMGEDQLYTVWSGILYGLGGRALEENWAPAIDSPAGAESLALFVEMFKYAPPHSENRGVLEANKLFLQGRGAMYLAWPSLVWAQRNDPNISKVAGKIGAAVIPGGKPQLSSWSLVMNPASKNLEAARRWIAFLVEPANTKRMMLDYGQGSPRLSTYTDPECQARIFYEAEVLAGLRATEPRLRIPPSQELCDYLDMELRKAIRGQQTPQVALKRAAVRWREILGQTGYLHP